jgi:hypothetical protein
MIENLVGETRFYARCLLEFELKTASSRGVCLFGGARLNECCKLAGGIRFVLVVSQQFIGI